MFKFFRIWYFAVGLSLLMFSTVIGQGLSHDISLPQPSLRQQLKYAQEGKVFAEGDTNAIVLESYKVETRIKYYSDLDSYKCYLRDYGVAFDVETHGKVGMCIYLMNWKRGDRNFQTKALVDDRLGVVFDPIGSVCVPESEFSQAK